MNTGAVLAGEARWAVEQGDCLMWLGQLPADSVSLCLFSPPYEAARTYGIDFSLRGQDWVDWMVQVFIACRRVCTGLVACVCEGQTRDYRYSAAPVLLMADLHRAGFHLRKPPAYHRVGIPGSGGKDWLRNDYEFVVCTTRGGRLPWAENTACGHPPKWAPGGEMSNRKVNGALVNQRGGHKSCTSTSRDGGLVHHQHPSYVYEEEEEPFAKPHTKRKAEGTERQSYGPPVLANPGNVIACDVGGGQMGSLLCHENEAPYPEDLAAFFVRSFCPPGGVCCDPFSGSGTTGAVAVRWGRRFIGCDVRESQVELGRRRISGETPDMFETQEQPS